MQYSSLQDINAAGTLVAVNISMIGTKIQVPKTALKESAQAAGLDAVKPIIDKRFIEPVRKAGETLRGSIKALCIPRSALGDGIYWTSNSMIPQIEEIWQRDYPNFTRAVRTFIQQWPDILADARRRLGEYYTPSDYPNESILSGLFNARIRRFNFTSSPASGSSEDVRDMVREFQQDVSLYLRTEFGKFVTWLVERLTPQRDDSGQEKRPVFRDSRLQNFQDFMERFSHLNIANDGELEVHIRTVRALLAQHGITRENGADRLRTNDTLAEHIRVQMDSVRREVDSLITTAPSRFLHRD